MGTIVSFQAHPDDESITTAATLARAAATGHRAVIVFATRGELGEPVPGVLKDGEQLAMRRSAECHESAAAIGAKRVEFLGYTDSGMIGEESNAAPYCFWQADVEHAARRLALILDEERADVLTIYDDNGGYGHPDHIQVHLVGRRAAELAGVPVVAQSTIPREAVMRRFAELRANAPEGVELPNIDLESFGKPEAELTHRVVAVEHAKAKRASMHAHKSQMGPDHFMLTLPDDVFAATFGIEHYIVEQLPAEVPELFTELFTPIR